MMRGLRLSTYCRPNRVHTAGQVWARSSFAALDALLCAHEDQIHLWKGRELNILDHLFGRTTKADAERPSEEISQ